MNEPNTGSPIVVGVDDSAVAREAAVWAARLANHSRTDLLLVCAVVDPSDYYYRSRGMPMYPNLTDELRKSGQIVLERARDAVHDRYPKVSIDTMLGIGPAEIALVQLSGRARLTVVGAHTDPVSRSTPIGPTALRVADHAAGPVAVWRGDPDRPVRADAPVVLGVGGGPANAGAVEDAFEIADALRVPLTAVHAWHDSTPDQALTLLAESLSAAHAAHPDVDVRHVARDGPAAHVLLQCAEHAQALVVASRVHSGVLATLLGSTTQHLLHHARVPLVIHRDHLG